MQDSPPLWLKRWYYCSRALSLRYNVRLETGLQQQFSTMLCDLCLDMTIVLGLHKFNLQATIDHRGPTLYSGHYTASINCCKNILLQRQKNYGVWNDWYEKQLYCFCGNVYIDFIALWWWFWPCRVGGAVWNHTAWLFPQMPSPTESFSIHIFYLVINVEKNITSKNIRQFQFCINLLPLALIWRSAPCLKHWNQRWFADAAFTIPSGKQWDHMSPWSPSWLSAGIEECCRSANESGHQWLKNSWLETTWH